MKIEMKIAYFIHYKETFVLRDTLSVSSFAKYKKMDSTHTLLVVTNNFFSEMYVILFLKLHFLHYYQFVYT